MTRKFKTAGVLAAVLAMLAITASSASALFTSTVPLNSGTASSTGDVFTLFGSTGKCTSNAFYVGKFNATAEGEHVEAQFPTSTLTVEPTYGNCTFFGLPATVNFTGCDYVFHTQVSLTVDLACPAGVTGVDVTIFSSSAHSTALCHVVVHPFTGKGGLTATNWGGHISVRGILEGITATQDRTSFLCPAGTHTSTAKYATQAEGITIVGTPGSVLSVD